LDAAVWGFVGTLLGVVVGSAASITTTTMASRNALHLQDRADSLERSERARAFQRDNLLAVQDALQDLARLTGRAHHEDFLAHRESGVWGRSPLSEEVDEGLGLANRRLTALVERVADDELRSKLKAMHSSLTRATMASSREEADARMEATVDEFTGVMARLGEVLRSLY